MSRARWALGAALCVVALTTLASEGMDLRAPDAAIVAGDPLEGDPADSDDRTIELPAGAPWVLGAEDDDSDDAPLSSTLVGDIDLVVRVGDPVIGFGMPATAPLRGERPLARVGLFGDARPLPFVVLASDGSTEVPGGHPVQPDYWSGLPILVLAFADLDGDGFIGITHLDGEPGDAALEELELYPVARRYAIGRRGVARGELSIGVGSPLGASIALAAAAIAGPFAKEDMQCVGCHAWPGEAADALFLPIPRDREVVPRGPYIFTRLPFMPRSGMYYRPGLNGFVPAHADGRVSVQIEMAFRPDPNDLRVGEAFTLLLDGSQPSIDVARARSGPVSRFGFVHYVDPLSFTPLVGRSVRPGVDADGLAAPVEVLDQIDLRAELELHVAPLDVLGNVTVGTGQIIVEATGDIEIVSPDTDGDLRIESIFVDGAHGTPIRIRPVGRSAQGWVSARKQSFLSILRVGGLDPSSAPAPDVVLPPYDDDSDRPSYQKSPRTAKN